MTVSTFKPIIPGTRITFSGAEPLRIEPSFAEVVAIPLVHDWGPDNAPTLCTSFAEFTAIFGDSDTAGRTAVAGAFDGEGLEGAGGAGGVIVHRMATAAAAKATRTLNNTAGVPAAGLILTAKHKGTRGNDISVSIADDPRVVNNDLLKILFKGTEVERYSYPQATPTVARDAINLKSSYVVASAAVDGFSLALTAGSALTGGLSGDTVTSVEWLAALDALEFGQFSVLVGYNLTDAAIIQSLLTFVRAQEEANRPIMAVVGGATNETVATAVLRSDGLNDPHVVNIGAGTYHDSLLGKDLSTAQIAPRVAGVLAARGEEKSLDKAKLARLTAVAGSNTPAVDEIATAINGGVTVLTRASHPLSDIEILRGITSFKTANEVARPLDVFSDPRMVRVMDFFVREMRQWGDDIVIGNLPVNDDTRAVVRGEGRRRIDELEERNLIVTGSGYINVDPPTNPALFDSIPFEFGWVFRHTARYVLGYGKVEA